MKDFAHGVEEVQKLVELGRQCWLLGAGASFQSGIPLMYPLTSRVQARLPADERRMFDRVVADLPDDAHVEHVLSHIGDLIAIAERSKGGSAYIGKDEVTKGDLQAAYKQIVSSIAETVRYGYRRASGGDPEAIGTAALPIVEVTHHRRFIQQIFKGRANLEPRSQISFATTNYDTLLEDALALERRVSLDGFTGGAIGYWDGLSIDPQLNHPAHCHRVLKLHGSVDWFHDDSSGLLRVRYGVKYLSDLAGTLIYPQATKYIETQRDPFARIFDCFRRSLHTKEHHILGVVGYSFGDNHINNEIEASLLDRNNKTVMIAFSKELQGPHGKTELPPTLKSWLKNPTLARKIYVASDRALYHADEEVRPPPGKSLEWWSFSGLTKFLESGTAC